MTAEGVKVEKAKRKASAKVLVVYQIAIATKMGGPRYEVRGGSKPHKVDLSPGAQHKCSCMDWNIRGRSQGFPCKHLQAVEEFQGRQDLVKQTEVTGLLDEETKALLRRAADMRMRGR
jgi:hypothetical protein